MAAGEEAPPPSPHPKRPGLVHRHSSNSSHVSHSPGDSTQSHTHRGPQAHHKVQRHVVGHHGRTGRNPSFHRSLSKIKITPYERPNDETDDPPTPKAKQPQQSVISQPSVVPPSPARPNMKRNNTALHLPRNPSHTGLKKNHSSGQLQRLGTTKHVSHVRGSSQHLRPDIRRANTQPSKRPKSPAPKPPAAVHFDVGNDDDDDDDAAEDMEGVDDVWTEESASASPSTTRDNTRSNTRQNSVVLDPEQNPFAQQQAEEQPLEDSDSDTDTGGSVRPVSDLAVRTKDFAVAAATESETAANTAANSSYHDTAHQQRMPDPDAIARRLLERSHSSTAAPPRVSSISALANASLSDPKSLSESNNGPSLYSTAGTPVVSRFTDGTSSKDGTPAEQSGFLKTSQGGHSRTVSQAQTKREQTDLYRNQSTPNFASQKPSTPSGSGAVTPDPTLNQSRTQQKLWLQRGLSNIEATSQPHLPGLLPTGRAQAMRTPHAGKQFEFVDKEWAVVRRFQNPLDAALERLKKMNGGNLPGKPGKTANGTNGHAQRPSTAASTVSKKSEPAPEAQPRTSAGRKARVSFHMGELEGENDDDGDDHYPPERETPADVARRLWEQPIGVPAEA